MPEFNGGINGPKVTITGAEAKGIWTLKEQQLSKGTGVWPVPLSENYLVLLQGDNQANGSTTIVDSSAKSTISISGNTKISTSIFKYGTGSIYFDGNGDYLTLTAVANNNPYSFGTGDFTVECWVYIVSSQDYMSLYDARPSGTQGAYLAMGTDTAAQRNLSVYVNGATRIASSNSLWSTNTWFHVAVSRVNGSTRLFYNGVQQGLTWADNTNYINAPQRPVIGAIGTLLVNYWLNGYIDDYRILKGVGLYSANFTPPDRISY